MSITGMELPGFFNSSWTVNVIVESISDSSIANGVKIRWHSKTKLGLTDKNDENNEKTLEYMYTPLASTRTGTTGDAVSRYRQPGLAHYLLFAVVFATARKYKIYSL